MLAKARKEAQAVGQHALFVCLPTFYNASTAPHQIMPNAADSAKHLRCRFLAKHLMRDSRTNRSSTRSKKQSTVAAENPKAAEASEVKLVMASMHKPKVHTKPGIWTSRIHGVFKARSPRQAPGQVECLPRHRLSSWRW